MEAFNMTQAIIANSNAMAAQNEATRARRELYQFRGQFAAALAEACTPVAAAQPASIVSPNYERNRDMTQRDEFDSAGTMLKIADHLGELVLFTPHEYVDKDNGVDTSFGKKDYVLTDAVILTAEGGPAEYDDAMILQGSLIGQLKRKIPGGRKLLGRIAKGEAKKGQQPPYVLSAPSDADKQLARDYLAGRVIEVAAPAAPADPFAV